ncbi:peroxidase family protein [Bradyrhizobium sp. 188]|uniref:peroxidase family protein n=1 Tax=Bradyrhizobium sp. 188 TaxID=2782656 RepID=UPI0020983172|nr:peroxidase family protein [Bradyrhizobium sp. 188]
MSRENDGFVFHRDLLQWVPDVIYRAVNFFVTWDKLPTLLGAVNLSAFRDRLRERNLHHTGYGTTSPRWNTGNDRWRSADGSFNSLDHPRMGMAGARFGRNFALSECVPDSLDDLLEPSPRVISEELLARHEFIPATSLNLLAAAWIQFETHNWFSHGAPKSGNEFKIPLTPNDEWPADERIDDCMKIRRTVCDETPREPWLGATPTFRNLNSHWWDAGQIYGSDRARQMQIRSGADGKIAVGDDGMLPADPVHPGADLTGFNDNWWVGLSLLHNLFAREHNVICDGARRGIRPGRTRSYSSMRA